MDTDKHIVKHEFPQRLVYTGPDDLSRVVVHKYGAPVLVTDENFNCGPHVDGDAGVHIHEHAHVDADASVHPAESDPDADAGSGGDGAGDRGDAGGQGDGDGDSHPGAGDSDGNRGTDTLTYADLLHFYGIGVAPATESNRHDFPDDFAYRVRLIYGDLFIDPYPVHLHAYRFAS